MADARAVAILAGAGDAALTKELLRAAGLTGQLLEGRHALTQAIADPSVAAVIVDDAELRPPDRLELVDALRRQPPWSDMPFIVVRSCQRYGDDWWRTLDGALVTLLERPLKRSTMEAAVRAAVRARSRQYEVRDLVHRLSEENRSKDKFIAMLGHELRNPLSVVASAIHLLGRSPDQTVRSRELIDRQVKNLARIVEDLLDISRMVHGKLSLKTERVDVCALVRRCVQEFGPTVADRAQALLTRVPEASVFVTADPVRLEQVLLNLVMNAVKYTPARGRIEVSVEEDRSDRSAVVRVRDDGVGIPGALMPHVFDLFTQADQTLARTSGGLGIGLALVKNIVELHGGVVSVSSEGDGHGSEFVVRLPLAAAPSASVAEEVCAAGQLRIVLVEDNADMRESLVAYLLEEGHSVWSAGDGREGAELIVNERPDVAVVDIGLPTIDGYEVARLVRAKLDKVRLLALTGYGRPQDRQMAFEAGFDGHVVKPIDPSALLRLLTAPAPPLVTAA